MRSTRFRRRGARALVHLMRGPRAMRTARLRDVCVASWNVGVRARVHDRARRAGQGRRSTPLTGDPLLSNRLLLGRVRLRLGDRDGHAAADLLRDVAVAGDDDRVGAEGAERVFGGEPRVVGSDFAAHRDAGTREAPRERERRLLGVGAPVVDGAGRGFELRREGGNGDDDLRRVRRRRSPTTCRASRRRGRGGRPAASTSRPCAEARRRQGAASCMSHQTMPATTSTAAATPSQVLRNAAPTITSAPTITTRRNRNASDSLRSGLRIRGCRRSGTRRSTSRRRSASRSRRSPHRDGVPGRSAPETP